MSARVVLLLTATLALAACDQPAAQDETSAPPASAVQMPATPAVDGASGQDCGTSFFYNFSDQRGSGQVMCSSNQQG